MDTVHDKGPSPMRYESPATAESASQMLAAEAGLARILAGGTDLLVQMRTDMIDPVLVVDVKGISEMRTIQEEAGGFRIGAAVTGAELKEHAKLKAAWPGLVEAANLIGSTQIQGRATLGGNLCNASPAADSVPALIAAGAKASIVGPSGRRDVPVEEVVTGVRKLSLAKGELVVSFLLPPKSATTGDAYLRFIPRTEMDIAVVGCAVTLSLDAAGTCTAARVSLGAVAERALIVADAAKALVGTKVDAAAIDSAAAACSAACRPIDDKRGTKEFRIKIASVLAHRTIANALARAKGQHVKGLY
jgi:aerobic carbon-monoxide dehydrogenase medium subunit